MYSRYNVEKVARLIAATGVLLTEQQIVTRRHWFSAAWAHKRHQQQPNVPLQRPSPVQLGQHCLSDPYRYQLVLGGGPQWAVCVFKWSLAECWPLHISCCSWLSSYEESKGYLDEEKLHFSQAAKRLASLQQELLRELRLDVKIHQV